MSIKDFDAISKKKMSQRFVFEFFSISFSLSHPLSQLKKLCMSKLLRLYVCYKKQVYAKFAA